jgi:hypothetical protein
MTSRHGVRPLRLTAVAAVIALIATLFAATAAHAGTGSITGKVTKPSSNALSGLTVGAYKVSNGEYTHVKNVTTRSDGTYTLGSLDRGRYVVAFGENALKYVTEYWNNKPSLESATTIGVSTSRVSSINAKMASGGAITGTIQKAGGLPVEDAAIAIFQETPDGDDLNYLKTVTSAADGTYLVGGLWPGRYSVEFGPPLEGPDSDLALEYWDDRPALQASHQVGVNTGEVTEDINAELAPGGRVSGRVTGPDGEPVEDALVFSAAGDWGADPASFTFTHADGSYVLKGLSAGEQHVKFVGPSDLNPFGDDTGYSSEWWDDVYSWSEADPIAVVAGETSTSKDAQLNSSDTPFVNLTRPSISGTPEVGEPLKGNVGRWSPDVSVQPRWFVNGVEVQREGVEFVPEPEHVGKVITLEVGPRSRTAVATSDPTEPVAPGGPLVNTAKPSWKHGEKVGDTLYFNPGTYTARGVTLSHQLLADGAVVPGVTRHNLEITPDLLGKRLSVRETATRPGRGSITVVSDETLRITEGVYTNVEPPKVADPPIVGVPLTAANGSWQGTGSWQPLRTFDHQWFANGVPIPGGDEATFTPTAAESGQALTVHVRAVRAGYRAEWATSAPTKPVVEPGVLHVQPGDPYFYGSARVGQRLDARPGDRWSPTGLTYSYRWLADQEPIPGATGQAFTVTEAQSGKRVSVEVTGARNGFTSASAVYGQDVPETTPFGAPQNLHSAKETMTSIDLAWTQVEDAVKYRIYYGIGSGERTRVEVSDIKTTLQWLKAGTEYSIDIAAIKDNGTRSAYSPRVMVSTAPIPKPTDLRVDEKTPTILIVRWAAVPGIPRYRLSYGIGTGTRTTTYANEDPIAALQGLEPNTTYSIDIASQLTTGQRSGYTSRILATTAPFLPPTNLASPGNTSSTIDLTWKKAPSATNYRISYGIGSGTRTTLTVGNISSSTLRDLKAGTTYNIKVAALLPDGTRSPYSPPIDVTTD